MWLSRSPKRVTISPSTKWEATVLKKERYRRELQIRRRSTHILVYFHDFSAWVTQESLTLDGVVLGTNKRFRYKKNWEFTINEGGEAFPARVTMDGSVVNGKIRWFRLEVGGLVIYEDRT